MVFSVLGASALFIALMLFLNLISATLADIGGEDKEYGKNASFLSNIRVGLRAIEVETGMIPTQVTKLNATLTAVRDGLIVVDDNLGGVIAAVSRQGAS
ncbi:MAG: hypothetical protein H0W68_14315 [Gemmatimonadaceae bacterium]|nr:hypothetical protein [Geodermatophilaceae bacterium]MBA3673181.1 hypothetical protein [Gemmatimonadaceae bacterium]